MSTNANTRQNLNFKSVMNTNRVTKAITKEITSTVSLNPGMKVNQLEKFRKYADIKSGRVEKQENIIDYSNNSFGNNSKHEVMQPVEKKREKIEKSSVERVSSRSGLLRESNNQNITKHKKKPSEIPNVNTYLESSHINDVQNNGMGYTNTGHLATDIFLIRPQNTNPKLTEREEKVFIDLKALGKYPAHLRTEKSCDSSQNSYIRPERKESLNKKVVKLNLHNDEKQNNINYPKEDRKYTLLLSQYHSIVNERNEMAKVIAIMKCAIESQQRILSHSIGKKQEKVRREMIRLKTENELITKQNKELKMIILKMFYNIKSFEMIEIAREKEIIKNLSQLLTENEYLRTANEKFIKNSQIENEEYAEINIEDTAQNRIETNNHYQTEIVHCMKPPKGLHKRQKTHYNLHTINNNLIFNTNPQKDKDGNKTQNDGKNSSKESNTVLSDLQSSESDDLFGKTLKDMGNMNKTLRKTVDNKKPSDVTSPTSMYNSNMKKQALFYRTPGNKEHKKIEFTK